MRLRYVVDPRKRRAINNLLTSKILENFEKEDEIVIGTINSIDAGKPSNAFDKEENYKKEEKSGIK